MSNFFELEDNFDIDEGLNKELSEDLFEKDSNNYQLSDSANDKKDSSIPFTLEELKKIGELKELDEDYDVEMDFELPDISDIKPIDLEPNDDFDLDNLDLSDLKELRKELLENTTPDLSQLSLIDDDMKLQEKTSIRTK